MGDISLREKCRTLIGPKTKVLLAVELLLMLVLFGMALGNRDKVLFSWDSKEGDAMETVEAVRLPRGTYRVQARYEYSGQSLDPGSLELEVTEGGYYSVFANGIAIYAGTTDTCLDFIVAGTQAEVLVVSEREEGLHFSAVEIIRTGAVYWKYLCAIFFFAVLTDILVFIKSYDRLYGLSDTVRVVGVTVPGAAMLASFPSFTDYQIVGADLVFHLLRIEALRTAILNGELHVRMQSFWLAGHGYANSFFYGDTLLIFPAMLRVAGFTPDFAYRAFLFMINLLTAGITYYSFDKMFHDRRIGVFACVLYTLAPYRIYNCYNRSAVGEFVAMTFLPLLIYGFYRIYQIGGEKEQKTDRYSFLIPVIGFSGIIQSHMLSCEMAGIFTVLLCLGLWKKTFSPKIFWQLCLVVIGTVLVNAWYIVPCLDLMAADKYYFGHNANVLIQSRGVYPWQIFYTLQAAGSSSKYPETGFVDAEPISMGIAMLAGVLILLWELAEKRFGEYGRHMRTAGITVLILLGMALFMSTELFPWDFFSEHGLNGVVGPIQFPTRFTTIVTILALTAGCIGVAAWRNRSAMYIIAALSVVFAMYQTNDIVQTKEEQLRIYSGNGMGTTGILGAEYLPEGASVGHMTPHLPVASEGVRYESYRKQGLQAEAYVSADQAGYLEFPMLYYKGYTAYAADSGMKCEVKPGDEYDVRVELPEGFAGNLHVGYSGMWYWHVAEAVSVLTGIVLFFWYLMDQKKQVYKSCK